MSDQCNLVDSQYQQKSLYTLTPNKFMLIG